MAKAAPRAECRARAGGLRHVLTSLAVAGKAAVLALLLAAPVARAEKVVEQATEPLRIVTGNGPQAFAVEIADEPKERSRGLMFREQLAADRGMLFDFGHLERTSMWMRNTLIPLDMLFIDDAGGVVGLVENARPHDETPLGPEIPVRAVLEVAGGTAERLGLRLGDQVCHPLFTPPEGACRP